MQWSVTANLARDTAKSFLKGSIPIIGEWLSDAVTAASSSDEWLSEALTATGSSPDLAVKLLYANQDGANKFILRGNFPVPKAACPPWFQDFKNYVNTVGKSSLSQVIQGLYNLVEALCGLSSFEFQFNVDTSAGISVQNTYLQVNSSNGIKKVTLNDLNNALRDGSICAVNCELCKSQNRCRSNSACSSGYCKNGPSKTSVGCQGTCMAKLDAGGDCGKDALNIVIDTNDLFGAGDSNACKSGQCTCGRCTDSTKKAAAGAKCSENM
jgi:hypothetical protein